MVESIKFDCGVNSLELLRLLKPLLLLVSARLLGCLPLSVSFAFSFRLRFSGVHVLVNTRLPF